MIKLSSMKEKGTKHSGPIKDGARGDRMVVREEVRLLHSAAK